MGEVLKKSWLKKYEIAKEYYEKHGNLDVAKKYIYKGLCLKQWISEQRYVYHKGRMNQTKIALLEDIGVDWSNYKTVRHWIDNYEIAKRYYEKHGNLFAPTNYCIEGLNLREWLNSQRNNIKNNNIKLENIELLNQIGMIWDSSEYIWQFNYQYAKQFYEANNHLKVSANYKIDDFNLYAWLHVQKEAYCKGTLDKKKINLLEDIGICWFTNYEKWLTRYEAVKEYYITHGDFNIPKDYKFDGISLYGWLHRQENINNNSELNQTKIKLLKEIGFYKYLEETNLWNMKLNLARKYYETHGDLLIPREYTVAGVNLGRWISNLRLKKDSLDPQKIKQLEEIGMVWRILTYERNSWEESYEIAKAYYEENGDLLVPQSCSLGIWIASQRKKYFNNTLTPDQISLLENIGMVWNVNNYKLVHREIKVKSDLVSIRKRLVKILDNMLEEQDENYDISNVEQDYIRKLGL